MKTLTAPVLEAAYHEAGHAVATLRCGVGLRAVQVKMPGGPEIIDCDGEPHSGSSGLTTTCFTPVDPYLLHAVRSRDRRSEQIKILNQVFVDGAGLAAEAKYRRLSRDEIFDECVVDSDLKSSTRRLVMFGFSWKQASKIALEIWEATADLTTSEDVWGAVEAIAEATLDGHGRDGEWITDFGRALLPDAPSSPLDYAFFVPNRFFERLWRDTHVPCRTHPKSYGTYAVNRRL